MCKMHFSGQIVFFATEFCFIAGFSGSFEKHLLAFFRSFFLDTFVEIVGIQCSFKSLNVTDLAK